MIESYIFQSVTWFLRHSYKNCDLTVSKMIEVTSLFSLGGGSVSFKPRFHLNKATMQPQQVIRDVWRGPRL